MKKKSVIFVISDFIDEGFDESLRFLGQKHEVVALIVEDQAEINIPDVGVVDLQDPETGEVFTVDTSSSEFRKIWQQERKSLNEKRDRLLRQSQVDRVLINSSENYADQLVAYFKTKKLRR